MTKSKPVTMARQGDILVSRISSIPKAATPVSRENGRVVLAHGEATGHTHSFGSRRVNMYAVADEFSKLGSGYIKIEGKLPAPLQHQEHSPISFAPGSYRVTRQREYVEGEIVRVED